MKAYFGRVPEVCCFLRSRCFALRWEKKVKNSFEIPDDFGTSSYHIRASFFLLYPPANTRTSSFSSSYFLFFLCLKLRRRRSWLAGWIHSSIINCVFRRFQCITSLLLLLITCGYWCFHSSSLLFFHFETTRSVNSAVFLPRRRWNFLTSFLQDSPPRRNQLFCCILVCFTFYTYFFFGYFRHFLWEFKQYSSQKCKCFLNGKLLIIVIILFFLLNFSVLPIFEAFWMLIFGGGCLRCSSAHPFLVICWSFTVQCLWNKLYTNLLASRSLA